MGWEKRAYKRVMKVITEPLGSRGQMDMEQLEPWFRKKSDVLNHLTRETLLDVIQHCEFVTRQPDEVIIHQGEKGHRFYIILRGNVSILHKDALEDVDLGEEGEPRTVDRSTLGNELVRFGEGATFGEIALINPDCIRTASVVANEKTDLVVIHRDLYNRSVSKVIAREYAEKMAFIDSVPIFKDWSQRLKKQLAASLKKECFSFDCPIVKQGDPAMDMYFVVSGEVKLQIDPEAQQEQFYKFIHKYGEERPMESGESNNEKAYFPTKFLPQIEKYSRVSKTQQLHKTSDTGAEPLTRNLPTSWSPSAIRHMNQQIQSKKVNLNLCYLGDNQYFGDAEFLLGLNVYHATAICSSVTTVMSLYKPHYDRLFKRRNPQILKNMAETLELQLSRRILKPNIIECVPLLKYFIYRLQDIKKDSGRKIPLAGSKDENNPHWHDVPSVKYEDVTDSKSRHKEKIKKSYSWSDAIHSFNSPAPFKPRPAVYRSGTHVTHAFTPRKYPEKSILSGEHNPSGKLSCSPQSATSPRPMSNGHSIKHQHTNGHSHSTALQMGDSSTSSPISTDTYRTFGSGFRSIGGKCIASSYDHTSKFDMRTVTEVPVSNSSAFEHHSFIKTRGTLIPHPVTVTNPLETV